MPSTKRVDGAEWPEERPKLMTRKQLLYPFDSDSDDEVELQSDNDKFSISEAGTPICSAVSEQVNEFVQDDIKEFIRRPLTYYAYNKQFPSHSFTLSSSSSSSSPSSTSSSSLTSPSPPPASRRFVTNSNSCGFNRMVEPVELAPGLLDVSPAKPFRLQRANSAPIGHSLLVDPRRRPLSRHEELTERVRKLLEQTRKEAIVNKNTQQPTRQLTEQEMERQKRLRERARKLIAEARQGISGLPWSSLDSPPTSPPASKSIVCGDNNNSHIFNLAFVQVDNSETRFTNKAREINGNEEAGAKIDTNMLNNLNNTSTRFGEFYASYEIDVLARKEEKTGRGIVSLEEKAMRRVMSGGDHSQAVGLRRTERCGPVDEGIHAVCLREERLDILEKEADAKRRFKLLNNELRLMLAIEDFQKTAAQRQRENLLLDELVKIVNIRDELVQHLDTQELAIGNGQIVKNSTSGPIRLEEPTEKNCAIQ